MDTINIILQEAKTNSIDFVTIITIIKDIATIAAILVGIYFGHKGLRRFLLDDLIKSKISDLHNTNQEVFQFTKKIISTIINKEDLNRPADENDISYIKKQTQKLVKLSNGASKEVATLCFFLNETVRKIRPKIKSKTYVERLMAPDIFNLLYNTSVKINQFSSNIIDLPRRIQLEPYNEINKSLHKFLNREDTHRIKGIQFGLNLNSNSSLTLLFSSIINKSTTGHIFKKQFFQLLKTNVPIVYELLINKIYFPVILETDTDMPVAGKRTLHMVRFNINKSYRLENNTEKEIIEFYYSNIKRLFSFLNTIKPDKVPQIYKDVFINDVDIFASLPFDVKILADETIKIVCNKSDAEMYFKKVKRKFIKRIKKLK